jgi:hypothetical protein
LSFKENNFYGSGKWPLFSFPALHSSTVPNPIQQGATGLAASTIHQCERTGNPYFLTIELIEAAGNKIYRLALHRYRYASIK